MNAKNSCTDCFLTVEKPSTFRSHIRNSFCPAESVEEEIGLHLRKNLITKKHFDLLTNIDDAILEYFIDCTFNC